jgi:CheY-like chemotaxis protein
MVPLSNSSPPATVGLRRAGGLSLLIVENDDADAYLILRALLSHPAVARVAHAIDGEEALRMLRTGEVAPDIAFVGVGVAANDDFCLMTELARSEATLPVVALTAAPAPTDAANDRLRAAVRVIVKPHSAPLLEAALASAVDSLCPQISVPPPASPSAR